MKRLIIILISMIIFFTLLLTFTNKNNEAEKKYEYNNTYYKTTNTYINDALYSIRKETIILEDGFINYESIIKYTDKNIEPIKLEYIDTYIEKKDRIITDNKTYYLNSKKLCLESIDCDSPYTINNNNEVNSLNNFNIKNYVKTKKEISLNKEGIEVYVILDKSSKEYKKVLHQVAYDLNITINIIELTNKLKKDLLLKYNINEYPVTFVYFNNELISTNIGNKTHKELTLILFLLGIDYR